MQYTNNKYTANTISIFVPTQYKPHINAVIEYQNTQQDPARGEFICAIECSFSFGGDDEFLLVTTQYGVFKRVLQRLFDRIFVSDLLLDMELPQEDDDAYIKSACTKQQLGNIWFLRDWLLPVPLAVHWAATDICKRYEGFVLTSIKPEEDGVYTAWYIDTTLDLQDDGYIMYREFKYTANNKVVDITFGQ